MKKLLVLIAITFPMYVQGQTQKYAKYVKKYDVIQYLPPTCDKNPGTFWRAITENNHEFQQQMKKFDNPKGLAKKALQKIGDYSSGNTTMTENQRKLSTDIAKKMLGDGDNYGMVFAVSSDEEWNAYSLPDGRVYINKGLLNKLDYDEEMILGILAHEVAHYLLRHQLVHEYKSLKKEQQNNIGAAIGAVGTAVGNIAAASAGVDKDYGSEQYTQWFDSAKKQSTLARFKYSRDEETEADIIAYRFLEWTGHNPENYALALEKINIDYLITKDDKEREHPTTEFRVGVLRQIQSAPFAEK